ncbi:uncharacterized protein LOC126035292 [Accipiter gentilis]|uniref:uncharacterized protein LOC126035292 n=1 Tax=Astur gentilis TaxID=8957 RepID=UPI00210F9081|nr:uncharacterized protein LOC126035292 [Accipiter gentilis]
MGKYLEKWAPPMFWKFTPEQVQDPEELVKYLEKVCCHPGSSREIEITATCWGLAHAYRALFDTTQYPQGEEKLSRANNKTMSTAATQTSTMDAAAPPGLARSIAGTQTLATGTVTPPAPATRTRATQTSTTGTTAPPAPAMSTAATQTSATDTVVIQNPVSDTATEPEDQIGPVSVAHAQKKKYTKISARLAKDEGEPGSSQEQEEEAEPEVITWSLSLSELWDMRKDFGHRIGENIITWLLRCWDNGANSLELEGREAKQLGSLAREGGIDKAIGRGTQAISVWRRLLSSVKERYPFKEDVICQSSKWTTMEKGIQYLRELAVLETIRHDPDNPQLPKDPDEVQCTRPMWRKFVRSTPSSYANALAIMAWKDEEAPTMDEAARQLRQYEENLSSSLQACISAVEKLSQDVQQIKEDMSYSTLVRTNISAIRSERSSAQEREYRRYTPRGAPWFYLCDHGEDMRKWDGKPTLVLNAQVREL